MTAKEDELIVELSRFKGSDCLNLVTKLMTSRREKYRDKLESAESPEIRGRAKECKDLIRLFS